MVFDEIDAGIGGTTAHAVAETLRRLAERAQVVTITHLPQIATVADRHFRVEKVPGDPTHTRIEPLDDAQRARRARADARRRRVPRVASNGVSRRRRSSCSRRRADVWAFLAEPYHLSDWWPGITGVEPDRRGFAPGRPLEGARDEAEHLRGAAADRDDAPRSARSSRSNAGRGTC